MKIFLDTNVLVSGIATRGLCADVMRAVFSSHELVVSQALLTEVRRVLTEKIGFPEQMIAEFVNLLRQDAFFPPSDDILDIDSPDPDDIPILSSALNGNADIFVTGDKALLQLGRLKNMVILSPRKFWEIQRSS